MITRKGQAEVVGLLVLVIILLFVGMIFLRFSLTEPATSLNSVRQSVEANNVLQALVEVTIQGKPFTEQVDACNSDKTACIPLKGEIEAIFEEILKEGQKYSFTLTTEGEELIKLDNCQMGIVSTYSFIEASIFYETTLKLC